MLLVLSTLMFLLGRASGSPARILLPADSSPADIAELENRLGLDRPLIVQYCIFLGDTVTGHLGDSLGSKLPVTETIAGRFGASLQLVGFGIIIILLGIPLGTLAALRKDRPFDIGARSVASILQAVPHFWLGAMLALVFGAILRWLPVAGRSGWQSAILPAIALSIFPLVAILRVTRSSVLRVLDEEYVLVARAKGLPERVIIWKHVLRNSLIPVASLATVLVIVYFLTSSVVIEQVFAWPGLGYLAYQSVQARDFPVLQGLALLFGLIFIVGSIFVDLLIRVLDPRTRVAPREA
jgi:peptide/nickel transport system permease protein